MKTFLNAAVVVGLISVVATTIWVVWDQGGFSNAEKTAISASIVFATAFLCRLVWVAVKEL